MTDTPTPSVEAIIEGCKAAGRHGMGGGKSQPTCSFPQCETDPNNPCNVPTAIRAAFAAQVVQQERERAQRAEPPGTVIRTARPLSQECQDELAAIERQQMEARARLTLLVGAREQLAEPDAEWSEQNELTAEKLAEKFQCRQHSHHDRISEEHDRKTEIADALTDAEARGRAQAAEQMREACVDKAAHELGRRHYLVEALRTLPLPK